MTKKGLTPLFRARLHRAASRVALVKNRMALLFIDPIQ